MAYRYAVRAQCHATEERSMQILTRFAVIAVVALFLAACANRSYLRREEGFRPEGWASIVVLPFSGKGLFTDLATNIFTLQMGNSISC